MNSDSQPIEGYFTALCNWGRWGDEDELGTLNYVQEAQRRRAVDLIRDAHVVSCQRKAEASSRPRPGQALRLMVSSGEGCPPVGAGYAIEHLAYVFHGPEFTHLDSLGHVFWEGKSYNARPASVVTSAAGATAGSVGVVAQRPVLCRGVLLDVPFAMGLPTLGPSYRIEPELLDECARKERVEIHSGDAVLVRTGRAASIEAADSDPGLSGRCLPWLHAHEVSLLGSDRTSDATPAEDPRVPYPIHIVGIVSMGLWLLDNLELERLASHCASQGRWDFCFLVAPLAIEGATGSPVNPLAIF